MTTAINTAATSECEPIEGPLTDDELNAVNAGMLKPTGLADSGIQSLASTLIEQLGNSMAVGGRSSTNRGSG